MGEWLTQFWGAVLDDFSDLPDGAQAGHIVIRLLMAAVLSGMIGYEREQSGKVAGLRTHILVGLAAAFFALISQQAGMPVADISRVVQGIATGIGFVGAGAIIKENHEGRVRGLTTAAGLWLTAAVGIAAGLGREMSAFVATALALITLSVLLKLEGWRKGQEKARDEDDTGRSGHVHD